MKNSWFLLHLNELSPARLICQESDGKRESDAVKMGSGESQRLNVRDRL